MLHFVTLNWRNYEGRGVEYTNILFAGVRANLREGTPGKFVVFTDSPADQYSDGIEVRSLPHDGVDGWMNKLQMFCANLFAAGDRIIFLDLDTVITGPLDDIAAYDGPFAILRDAYRAHGLQSSVMAWPAGTCDAFWSRYESAGKPDVAGGDQSWIEYCAKDPVILQTVFPGKFASYKRDARFGVPPGASVVFFHGQPRPHDAGGWVESLWRLDAGTQAQLELVGNTELETMAANIRGCEARAPRWLEPATPHDGVALICAGGPSLAAEFASVAAHVSAGGKVFACNNAARALGAAGIKTDFHVVLDARPENAAFCDGAPEAECLYASACHESVHQAAGDRLTAWHPAFDGVVDIVGPNKPRTYIGGGTTAGMKALTLAWALGYRTLHIYGFDSCYQADAHHAYPQALNDGEQTLSVNYSGKSYRCAPWMVQQAEDFEIFVPQLMDHGCRFHVHGEGLIPDIAVQLAQGKFHLEAADFRAHAILERLSGKESPKVAEVGVFAGDLARRLLARRPDLELLMVDNWSWSPKPQYADSGDFHASLSKEQQDSYFNLAVNVTDFARSRRTIMRMDSVQAAAVVPDGSQDLVFIDADHSYEGCKSDINAWLPKVRPGGIIGGHDYDNTEFPCFGVKQAVDELVNGQGFHLELGENFTWFAIKQEAPHV